MGQNASGAPLRHRPIIFAARSSSSSTLEAFASQIPAKFGDPLVQLAEDDVASVAPQDVGLRYLRRFAHFVRVTQYEFARLKRSLMRIGAWDSRSFDCGMTDAVLEPERLFFAR